MKKTTLFLAALLFAGAAHAIVRKVVVPAAAAASAGGGLSSVSTDASLTGAGTAGSPLKLAPAVTASTLTATGNAFSVGGSSFTVAGGSATVAYQMSAGSFVGSGAALTGIPSTASIVGVYVQKAGDTMTGQLTLAGSTLTVTGNGFSVGASSFVVTGSSVGVRNAAPQAALHVSSGSLIVDGAGASVSFGTITSNGWIYISTASSVATIGVNPYSIVISSNQGSVAILSTYTASAFSVMGGTFSVSSTGQTCINCTNPSQALDVRGSIVVSSSFRTNNGIVNDSSVNNARMQTLPTGMVIDRNKTDAGHTLVVNSVSASGTGDVVEFQVAGSTKMSITSGGVVFVATTTNVTQSTMVVLGDISASSFSEGFSTQAATSGTSYNINWSSGDFHSIVLTGNCTFTFTNMRKGQTITLWLKQDATGSRIVTWPSGILWSGSAPTLTTTAAKTDEVFLTFDGTSTYLGDVSLNH